MKESYVEAGVKRKPTFSTFAAKAGLILLVIIMFFIAMIFSGQSTLGYILMMLACLMVGGLFYIFPRFNVDYEYIFCDGQLDFDMIMGGSKRKTSVRIDFENVEIMAPEKSHALDNYAHKQITKTKDFTSRIAAAKRYVIFARKGEQLMKITFEPSEKMIQCIKHKSPRKVVEF